MRAILDEAVRPAARVKLGSALAALAQPLGGLDIDTTSAFGFTASGGGTITVGTGTNNNSINATSGQAINLSGMIIGASNVSSVV